MIEREHYIGDEIDRAFDIMADEHNVEELAYKHPSELDYDIEYHGGNYLTIKVYE